VGNLSTHLDIWFLFNAHEVYHEENSLSVILQMKREGVCVEKHSYKSLPCIENGLSARVV
jgi:hypothetical protein